MKKPEFKIIKEDLNPYNTIIESTVVDKKWVRQFTIGEIEADIQQLNRVKQSLESKREIEESKIQNIKNQHPEVDLNIDEKIQIAYTLYQSAKAYIKEADKKIKEIDSQLRDYVDDLKEVFVQTGIKLPEPNEK